MKTGAVSGIPSPSLNTIMITRQGARNLNDYRITSTILVLQLHCNSGGYFSGRK